MNNTTAKSLGDKLSTLDLTDDEATMLTMLIGGNIEGADDDVVGFVHREDMTNIGVGELQECTISKADPIRGQIGIRIAPTTKQWSFGVENA